MRRQCLPLWAPLPRVLRYIPGGVIKQRAVMSADVPRGDVQSGGDVLCDIRVVMYRVVMLSSW